MGIFDFFKKKEEPKLSEELTLKDLQKGDFVDYFMKSWKVEEVTEYDWGNNIFSREFKLNAGDEIIYIEIDEEEDDTVSISRDVKMSKIQKGLKQHIIEKDEPPKELEYEGSIYFFSEENIVVGMKQILKHR